MMCSPFIYKYEYVQYAHYIHNTIDFIVLTTPLHTTPYHKHKHKHKQKHKYTCYKTKFVFIYIACVCT